MSGKKVLFVCLGNICRSPSAEAIFRHYVEQAGRIDEFDIDSAGTSAHHQGERADSRMRAHAARREYELTSLSRPLRYDDYYEFDYIIGMDEANRATLRDRCPEETLLSKISILTDWHPAPPIDHVPDPYYGGAEGFERVLDLIEDCTPHLLAGIDAHISH